MIETEIEPQESRKRITSKAGKDAAGSSNSKKELPSSKNKTGKATPAAGKFVNGREYGSVSAHFTKQ